MTMQTHATQPVCMQMYVHDGYIVHAQAKYIYGHMVLVVVHEDVTMHDPNHIITHGHDYVHIHRQIL